MVPTLALVERMMDLLSSDTTTLNKASPDRPKIALIKAPFTPSTALTIGALTFADFNGSTPVATVSGPSESIDPQNGNVRILMTPATASWETGSTANLPQVIFGWAIITADSVTLLGSDTITPSITLTASNQSIVIPPNQFELPPSSLR